MENGTASAFAVFERDLEIFTSQHRLNKKNSIFQAELSAIREAISWFIDSKYSIALIRTDSEASVKVLQKLFPSNEVLYNIYQMLANVQNKIVYVKWIRAHVGLIGNERADQLAKQVILKNKHDKHLELKYPKSLLKRHIKEKALTEWQLSWSLSDKVEILFRF